MLFQHNLTLKFEITVKLKKVVHHLLPLSPPNIRVQSLPPPFITTDFIYKHDRHTKKTLGYVTFYNPFSGLSYICILQKNFPIKTFSPLVLLGPFPHQNHSHEQDHKIFLLHNMIVMKTNKKRYINMQLIKQHIANLNHKTLNPQL